MRQPVKSLHLLLYIVHLEIDVDATECNRCGQVSPTRELSWTQALVDASMCFHVLGVCGRLDVDRCEVVRSAGNTR